MTEFFMLTLVAALMIISPGPDFAIVVKNSLTHGRTSGVYTAMGIAMANLCHVAVNLFGIGVVIAQSIVAFTIMKFLGAAYLLYLGYKGIRAKPAIAKDKPTVAITTTNPVREHNGFYNGVLTSLLNPKACLFFLSFFSVMLSPSTAISTQIFYGTWISSMALFWFILVAFFFTSPIIGKRIDAFKHWLERITGGVLILLGIKLLSYEVSR
ncbi:MAG TPA: LysE family transporter [Gammaproteobacteria bacterium]|nr:LysE family transporter [Gammaproteobacteria bacterium]